MATRTQVLLEDDIDGSTAEQTVSFAVNGAAYEIDLSQKNAQRFDQAIEPFRSKARRTSSTRRQTTRTTKSTTGELQAIRAWAKDNGHEVSDRGRMSASVIQAYRSAH